MDFESAELAVSYFNTKCRDEGLSFSDFCERYDVDEAAFLSKMNKAGYTLSADGRRFSKSEEETPAK